MDHGRWHEWIAAITEDDVEGVVALLAQGTDVNAQDEFGQSGLSYAVAYDCFASAQVLFAAGADVNAAYTDGGTPLDSASSSASPEFYAWLVSVGARRSWHYEGPAEFEYNNSQPASSVPARIVSKRSATVARSEFGGREEETSFFVTFHLESGARREFGLGRDEFVRLAEGDSGTLRHQGYRYLGFDRASS